ncbi:hypothetical protein NCS52_01240100 [Fusarium sp. LHS14.1]|nr:hypothetical protein NCS52_01591600 [Fusarium sp. LHS14.1]KAI8712971.1 hypothetical protein NCS52_01240100 [Fusarium sp. LHS14.1]
MAATNMTVRSFREEKRSAFHLKYTLGQNETGVEFAEVLSRFVSGRHGFFFFIEEINGVRTAEAVLSIPSRFRINAFSQRSRWKRAGATGSLVDLHWPEKGQPARSFLEKWAREVSRRPASCRYGSEQDLFLELDRHQDRDANRKMNPSSPRRAQRTRTRRVRKGERRRYVGSQNVTVVASDTVGDDHCVFPPLVEEPALSEDLLVEDPVGVDFTSFLDALEVPEYEDDCFVDFSCDDVLFADVNFQLDAMLNEQDVLDILV